MFSGHQLVVLVVIMSVLMPTTNAALSVLPPAQWSPVEDPRISKTEGEYCFSYDPNSVIAQHLWYRICGSFYPFYGANQSPVRIDPSTVKETCSPGNRLRYDSEDSVKGNLENDGYHAKFTDLQDERKLYGIPGYENTGFRLGSVHIHIGKKDGSRRTEHDVVGKHYDAEVHMVHTREEGSGQVAGLAVVGIFLSLCEGKENEELNRLLDKVEQIQEYEGNVCEEFFTYCDPSSAENIDENRERNGNAAGKRKRRQSPDVSDICKYERTQKMDYFSLMQGKYGREMSATLRDQASELDKHFCSKEEEQCPHHGFGTHKCGGVDLMLSPEKLSPSPRDYYYYYGSLTTPTMSESVLWQVMIKPLRITEGQLERLATMKSRVYGNPVSNYGNLRPLQKLNGRQINANICG